MKRVGTFAAIAFGSAAVLAAQGAGQTSQPGRSGGASGDTRQTTSSQTGTVTLTGCLQRAGGGSSSGASSSGPSGASASGASASGASYILTDASMGSGAGPSASGSSGAGAAGTSGSSASGAAGTSGSSAAGRSGSTYMLDGSASEFSSHVNKRVQVTGTMASASSGAGSSGAGSSGAGTSGAGTPGAGAGSSGAGASASGASSGQHFKVTSVREVGGDCSSSSSQR
jgi:hypothetical protein